MSVMSYWRVVHSPHTGAAQFAGGCCLSGVGQKAQRTVHASLSGNSFARSGSISTKFVPAVARR
jgi:hypothetical protein